MLSVRPWPGWGWGGAGTARVPGPLRGVPSAPVQQLGEQCAQEKECRVGVRSQGSQTRPPPPSPTCFVSSKPHHLRLSRICGRKEFDPENPEALRGLWLSFPIWTGWGALVLNVPLGRDRMAFPMSEDSGEPGTLDGETGEWGGGRLTSHWHPSRLPTFLCLCILAIKT